MTDLSFFIPGAPAPQGSKSRDRFGNMFEASQKTLDPWRDACAWVAREAIVKAGNSTPMFTGPVEMQVTFYIARPPSHYGTGRNSHTLKPSAPIYPATPPDLSKLTRAVEDAFTAAGVWKDDGQVVRHVVDEFYCGPGEDGAQVTIRTRVAHNQVEVAPGGPVFGMAGGTS